MADEKTVSDERLLGYLHAYAKTIELTAPKFRIIEGTSKGDNYVGLIYRVTIESIENGEVKKIELILKTTQINADALLEDNNVAHCFLRFLMLENLTPQGFMMAKSKIMDYPHLSLALRCLGELHAYSFITRSANPMGFEKLKRMQEPLFSQEFAEKKADKDNIGNIVTQRLTNVILKVLANEDKHYFERYQRFVDNITQNMIDATDGKAAEPYAVVNHGDSWTNNILFKYDQEKNPCDLRFIDLQICRYASPVLDLIYVLFCCCTQETRSKYFDQVIHEYYETLSKCIERAGYDPKILFPYEVLSQHFTKFGKYAAGMATYTVHIMTSNGLDIKSTYDDDTLQDRVQNDSLYRSMLIGTFKDLVDRNYI
ncbi:Uncharacterized protein DBV15_02200 [Temnothorax longispinosus]|uniref:CHK kinase-like domain-containing protein n=1 Tax=Temnothorax longispinosus TaxID=300112 RepID=A0A4S2KNV6_9HYME|nr:Uncharacterized protein DBV15_02200 [Temnothorax longispinosus]